MKIWHIGDTHTYHDQLKIPVADMVIFSGDCSNVQDSHRNANEVLPFLNWFKELPFQYKVMVAGNHDTSIERRLVTPELIRSMGITYLENEPARIEGFLLWGSPVTPTFSTGWSWNCSRHKIFNVWEMIPDNVDILITHGPPKGVLDLSINVNNELELCGDGSLRNKVAEIKPSFHCFGHIHNMESIKNAGIFLDSQTGTMFSNGSCVTDRKFGQISSNGNLFTL